MTNSQQIDEHNRLSKEQRKLIYAARHFSDRDDLMNFRALDFETQFASITKRMNRLADQIFSSPSQGEHRLH